MPDAGSGSTVAGARGSVVLACAVSVLGALGSAWCHLVDRAGAGPLALLAGVALIAAASATGRPGRPRERVLVSVADRAYDGAILGAVVWVARADAPGLATAALVAFGFGTLAAYARARACGLGYDLASFAPVSVVRVAVVGLALSFGWGTAAYVALAVWLFASAAVRVSQVWKEELA